MIYAIISLVYVLLFVGYVVYRDWLASRKDASQFAVVNNMLDRMMSQNWIDYVNGSMLIKSGEARYKKTVDQALLDEERRKLVEGEVPD